MKDTFILVEYNNVQYPEEYTAEIKEVAGHFDKDSISINFPYSLHTEYSYGKRKFNSNIISKYLELRTSEKNGIPQLWKSEIWAREFADFIIELTNNSEYLRNIEIHPPFNDYCSLEEFADRYTIFEKKIHEKYPDVSIVIENREGSMYRGGKFLFGNSKELISLFELIKKRNLKLGLVLDFPQLLTSEKINTLEFDLAKYTDIIDKISVYRHLIKGIHIWGKKKSANNRWIAHVGTLDTYFGNNTYNKNEFINGIYKICDDNIRRFLVPEVNSGREDLVSVLNDILK